MIELSDSETSKDLLSEEVIFSSLFLFMPKGNSAFS